METCRERARAHFGVLEWCPGIVHVAKVLLECPDFEVSTVYFPERAGACLGTM